MVMMNKIHWATQYSPVTISNNHTVFVPKMIRNEFEEQYNSLMTLMKLQGISIYHLYFKDDKYHKFRFTKYGAITYTVTIKFELNSIKQRVIDKVVFIAGHPDIIKLSEKIINDEKLKLEIYGAALFPGEEDQSLIDVLKLAQRVF